LFDESENDFEDDKDIDAFGEIESSVRNKHNVKTHKSFKIPKII